MIDIKFITKPDETGLGRIIVDGRFYGLPVAAVERFARYAALVAEWNQPVPLIEWQKLQAELAARAEARGAPFIELTLARLRAERDRQICDHEIRKAYNAACDRLDVLHSRITEANKNHDADSGASLSDAGLGVVVNGTNDLSFLKELRSRVQDGFARRDVGQIEFALKMIDDWIDELTPNGT